MTHAPTQSQALAACRDQFRFYEREHRAAGKIEKAETNKRFADMADAALTPASDDATVERVADIDAGAKAIIGVIYGAVGERGKLNGHISEDVYRIACRAALRAALPPRPSYEPEEERLGRFGHHPNAAIDFCHEVECCENDAFDMRAGGSREALLARIDRAMGFRVGGDIGCIDAKHALRQLEQAVKNGSEREYMDAVIAERAKPRISDELVGVARPSDDVAKLREALAVIADRRGRCGSCGTLAVGGGTGVVDCDCEYPVWAEIDAASFARAALADGEKSNG